MKIDVAIDVWLDNKGVELYVNDEVVKSYLLPELTRDYIDLRADMEGYEEVEKGEFLKFADEMELCAAMLREAAKNTK